MDGSQLVGGDGQAELVEHAASADGLELAGVADEYQSPALRHGEPRQLIEGTSAHHAGFVEDHRRFRWEAPPVTGVGPAPLVEELGQGVGGDGRLVVEDLGALG